MLVRSIKLNSYILHDVVKQLLICILKQKRKFSTTGTEYNEYYDGEYRSRNNNYFKKRFDNGFNNRISHRSGGYNRVANKRKFKFSNDIFTNDSIIIDWGSENLEPFKNDFYIPHPDVVNRSAREIEEFYRKHDIKIFGANCPIPIFNFHELQLPHEVSSYLSGLNFLEPTPIQSQTWPVALSGRDMVGISQTGSGKTLGYILPAVIHIQNQPQLKENEGPLVLILAPTRELVQQIQGVIYPIAEACKIKIVSVFGGSDKITQMNKIRCKNEIYVATPGRLLDFLNNNITNLKRCTYLVLDEADLMLNMGFEQQIRSIINRIRPDRQVLMWSATWPRVIRDLANSFLKNYILIQIGSNKLTANHNIIQIVHVCKEEDKFNLLDEILQKIRKEAENKTLIFANTIYGVEKVRRYLLSRRIPAETLHGNHSQNRRNQKMNDFRVGSSRILVATNVAGRGLDINDIKYVINFDFPNTIEEYIHKIGRTARNNNSGTAHTFFTPQDANLAQDLIDVLDNTNQIISPELKELADGRHRHKGRFMSGFRSSKY